MTVKFNDGGSGGDLLFAGKGRLAFWDTSSRLQINGVSYTLVSDLATLAADVAAHPGWRYAFADNYDASADGAYPQSPVNTRFLGTFEGLGNTISGLTIDGCCGLFVGLGSTQHSGTARDIVLAGEVIHAPQATSNGGLAGDSYGSIIGVSVISGSITSDSHVQLTELGGLVGIDSPVNQIIRSHASVRITCGNQCYAGGLVGHLQGSITQSSASGAVTARVDSQAGGLAGQASGSASVSLSFATGAVSVGDHHFDFEDTAAGGLIGMSSASGAVDQCYSTGAVSGGTETGKHSALYVGGLVGEDVGGGIAHSYATGSTSVGAGGWVGGFAGYGDSAILKQNYSTGMVSGDAGHAGGFIGEDLHHNAQSDSNYWDLDTSSISDPSKGAGNIANDPAVTGLTTAQFQSALPSGFDASVCGQSPGINNGMPYLLALPPQ